MEMIGTRFLCVKDNFILSVNMKLKSGDKTSLFLGNAGQEGFPLSRE